MPELEERAINNYFPKRFSYFDPIKKQVVTIGEILNSFSVSTSEAQFSFNGWESDAAFNQRKQPLDYFRFDFQTREISIRAALEEKIIEYLTDEDTANWGVTNFSINMHSKFVHIQIKHHTISNKTISQMISTEGDFDILIAENPEIVGLIQTFCWTFGQSNNPTLAQFN